MLPFFPPVDCLGNPVPVDQEEAIPVGNRDTVLRGGGESVGGVRPNVVVQRVDQRAAGKVGVGVA